MGTSGGALTRYFVVTDERDGLNDYDVQGLFMSNWDEDEGGDAWELTGRP